MKKDLEGIYTRLLELKAIRDEQLGVKNAILEVGGDSDGDSIEASKAEFKINHIQREFVTISADLLNDLISDYSTLSESSNTTAPIGEPGMAGRKSEDNSQRDELLLGLCAIKEVEGNAPGKIPKLVMRDFNAAVRRLELGKEVDCSIMAQLCKLAEQGVRVSESIVKKAYYPDDLDSKPNKLLAAELIIRMKKP